MPLEAGNELCEALSAQMGLFLCVNDRKQTLEIILLSLLLPHNKKTHFNWMHFYYFDSCVPEERADTHRPMDDVIGRKKSKFYLFCCFEIQSQLYLFTEVYV